MALRDFYPLSETAAQPLPEISAPITGESQAESALPTAQHLAPAMEQARRQLLALLLKNPQAIGLLTEQLSAAAGEGVDYSRYNPDNPMDNDIVQDNHFVQPVIELAPHSADLSRHAQLANIHFFPALLIRVAERIHTISCADPDYKSQLLESRRRLQAVRQQMIAGNTGLVAFVAYKHKTTCLSFDDLLQEGMVGLIRAVDRFDPGRGIRFSTYAIFWIKQAISRLIVKQEKVVRLPVALAEKASAVFEAMRSCYLENNRWPSLPELQAHCELAPEDIKTISSYYQATHSLDASLSDENDDQTLMTTLQQQQFALPLNELIDKSLSLYLGKVVASLPEKEAAILNMRFGLKNHTEMTLQAVADQLHVTRERVRQIQNEALKKLKQQFGYDLMPFLEPNDS